MGRTAYERAERPAGGRVLLFVCAALAAALVFLSGATAFAASAPPARAYGVFIGLERAHISRLYAYKLVVVDAQEFTKADIEKLHARGVQVYTYLNIGSIERERSYYKTYKKYTLGAYENWPGEYWMDVSKAGWRDYLVGTLGKRLADKKVDGFFLDNADVYYQYPRKAIYNGLVKIVKGLARCKKPLVINGGDTFVKKLLGAEPDVKKLIAGVNQESVLTNIDFENKRFGRQNAEDHRYYAGYLKRCKKAGLRVYLLEYGSGPKLEADVRTFAKENGYTAFLSPGLMLDGTKGF